MYNKLLVVEENTFLVTYSSREFSEEGERTINECFREEIAKADKVEISVAYCGYNSLKEIDRLVEKGLITQERKISRQYELGELIHKPSSLRRYRRHIAKLKSNNFSKNIVDLEQYKFLVVEEGVNKWGEKIWKTKITYTKKLFAWW